MFRAISRQFVYFYLRILGDVGEKVSLIFILITVTTISDKFHHTTRNENILVQLLSIIFLLYFNLSYCRVRNIWHIKTQFVHSLAHHSLRTILISTFIVGVCPLYPRESI
jgi:hypothetical protein